MSDDLVSEEMEEDIISELPCTLSIEDSTEDLTQPDTTDQVSFSHFSSFLFFGVFWKTESVWYASFMFACCMLQLWYHLVFP